MWPIGGFVLVGAGLLPSAWDWLAADRQQLATGIRGAYTQDFIFLIGAVTFLWIGEMYSKTRGPLPPAPYPGAFVEPDGRQRCPRGFTPGYLSFALVVSLIVPTLILVCSSAAARPLAAATLGPYLMVFIPQILLETRFLNRSVMTPVLPVLFMYYRLWQLIRSLNLAEKYSAAAKAAAAAGSGWMVWYLLSLLFFWVFDSGCTLIWMPWMYDWQLQDTTRLQHLARVREQQQLLLLQGRAASLLPAKLSDTGLAGRAEEAEGCGAPAGAGTAFGGSSGAARHRRGGGGPVQQVVAHHEERPSGGTDDYDSFGFGT